MAHSTRSSPRPQSRFRKKSLRALCDLLFKTVTVADLDPRLVKHEARQDRKAFWKKSALRVLCDLLLIDGQGVFVEGGEA